MGVKRFICFSFCMPEKITRDMDYELVVQALKDALQMLNPEDYVCLNIGNSRQRLLNDAQQYMEEYGKT